LIFEEILTSSADSLADALAAILIPGVLGAELIEVDADSGVTAWAGWTIACGTVASANI